ncbi:MAG: hypothetical protein JXQ25_03545 [Deltaproteobacteria bacterium]|nr:hypothetical protein [Deltaproteobacteria bacterium]
MAKKPRKPREKRSHIPKVITDAYLHELGFRDFMGELTEEEIPIAKEYGVYKYDAMVKEKILPRNG